MQKSISQLPSSEDSSNNKFPSSGGVSEGRGGSIPTPQESGKSNLASPEVSIKRNSKNFFELPFNPNLKKRARELRQAGKLPEVLFWMQVRNKGFKGFDFDRQKIIGNYIVDFYCSNCQVVIEIDGSSHDDKVEYDRERDRYLESLGLVVIHIPVIDVLRNMAQVMDMLFKHPAMVDGRV